MTMIRKGQAPAPLSRIQFHDRFGARAVVTAGREARAGRLSQPDAKLESPRPK
jgi:hypothetical protein